MSFDAIAPHYRWLERITAGPLLQRCRTEFMHEIRDARNILLLGEGRGRFLSEVLRQNPEAQITCVDASARMLEFSRAAVEEPPLPNRPRPSSSCSSSNLTAEDEGRERIPGRAAPLVSRTVAQAFLPAGLRDFPVPRSVLATGLPSIAATSLVAEDGKSPRPAARNSGISRAGVRTTKQFMAPPKNQVQFIHANILSERLPTGSNPFDAVASHFFLDCFRPDQLAQLCSKVAECTAPGARWLNSDFCLPERGWRRLRASWILWVLYRFFRLATRLPATRLTPPDEPLRRAGFRLKDRRHFNHGLLHSDLWVKGDLRDRFTERRLSPPSVAERLRRTGSLRIPATQPPPRQAKTPRPRGGQSPDQPISQRICVHAWFEKGASKGGAGG